MLQQADRAAQVVQPIHPVLAAPSGLPALPDLRDLPPPRDLPPLPDLPSLVPLAVL